MTLAAGAALVSLAPILVKAVSLEGLGPSAIGFWRCALGAAFVGGLAAASGARGGLPWRRLVLLWITGVAFAVDLFVWHRSVVLAGAGMATILGNTQVFATALLSYLCFGEAIRPRFVLAASAALIGVALLVGVGSPVEFTRSYLQGIGYGLATGLAYAVFLVLLRIAGRQARGPGATLAHLAWLSLAAAAALAATAAVEGATVRPPSTTAFIQLVALALVAQSLGWWAISKSLPHVSGAIGGLLLLIQPALATLWGALIFGEALAPLQVVGAGLTLVAIYGGSRRSS